MPVTFGYGGNISLDQTPSDTQTCPAKDNGQICGETIKLDKPYKSGDEQVNLACPNSNDLKPHAFHIFTAIGGTIQTFASTDID